MAAYVHSMRSYLGTGVKFALNCYGGNASRERLEVYIHEEGVSDLVLFISVLPGAKILFWKKLLTPSCLAAYDVLWLLDSDLLFDLDHFPLYRFLSIGMKTKAAIFQPTVYATIYQELRPVHTADRTVAQAVCIVEIMTPFIRSDMWKEIHRQGLVYIDDTILYNSSWGIDNWWCDFAANLQLVSRNSNTTVGRIPPACLVIKDTQIVHSNSRSMPREDQAGVDSRLASVKPWVEHSNKTNVSGQCERLDDLLRQRQQRLFYFDEKTMTRIELGSASHAQHKKIVGKEVPRGWKKNAAQIYNRNRHQDLKAVERLNAKWKDKVLIGNGSTWEFLQLLKKVIDPTDNSLLHTNQWSHVLQVYTAMKADNITSPKALSLALIHDFGKLLVLFGEDDANIMCSTIVLKHGELGRGLDSTITTWNHDEFGFQKLRRYLPPDMAWVIRYHSLSPLLKGELHQFLTPEELTWFPLLRLLWKYDHMSKRSMYTPLVDLQEVHAILSKFLPEKICF
ncbi:unnamed protein product [Rotaria magnacalcarata]|uniref:Inositol oxygenase n=2 Tax=Rotaria magnacalcarata TaxID=392030 RepID=A0A816XZ71_9BILA|nr:unnamed protein product [Rotaria magnacalcarata]